MADWLYGYFDTPIDDEPGQSADIRIIDDVWQSCGVCARSAACMAERLVAPGTSGAQGAGLLSLDEVGPDVARVIQVCRRCYMATDRLLPGNTTELSPEERDELERARAIMVPSRDLAHSGTPIALRGAVTT